MEKTKKARRNFAVCLLAFGCGGLWDGLASGKNLNGGREIFCHGSMTAKEIKRDLWEIVYNDSKTARRDET